MGLFNKTETRSSLSPAITPVIFAQGFNGISLVSGSDLLVNQIPALQAIVSTISNDMNAVRFSGGQSKALNQFNFVKAYRSLLIDGSAYLIIEKSSNGVITDLKWVANSDVTINLDRGVITYSITNNNDMNYEPRVYSDKEILAFVLNPDTSGGVRSFTGISPIQSLTDSLKLSQLAQKQIESQLNESILPKLHLQLMADTDDDTKTKIKKAFEAINQNDTTIITDSQIKVSRLFSNDASRDNLTQLSKTLSENTGLIATSFQVPQSKVGQAQNDDAQSSSKDIDQRYLDSLVHNYLSVVLNELREKVSDSIDLDLTPLVDFDNSKLIQQTIDLVQAGILQATEAQQLLKNKGVI